MLDFRCSIEHSTLNIEQCGCLRFTRRTVIFLLLSLSDCQYVIPQWQKTESVCYPEPGVVSTLLWIR